MDDRVAAEHDVAELVPPQHAHAAHHPAHAEPRPDLLRLPGTRRPRPDDFLQRNHIRVDVPQHLDYPLRTHPAIHAAAPMDVVGRNPDTGHWRLASAECRLDWSVAIGECRIDDWVIAECPQPRQLAGPVPRIRPIPFYSHCNGRSVADRSRRSIANRPMPSTCTAHSDSSMSNVQCPIATD